MRIRTTATITIVGALLGLTACGAPPGRGTTAEEEAEGTRAEADTGEDVTAPSLEEPAEPAPLGDAVALPGTGVTIQPPEGSMRSPVGTGYVHPRLGLQLVAAVAEGGEAIEQSFEESLFPEQNEVIEQEEITIDGRTATLGHDRQAAGQVTVERWYVRAKEGNRHVAVVAAYQAGAGAETSATAKAAVQTLQWDPEAELDPAASLGAELAEVEGLEMGTASTGSLTYVEAGTEQPSPPGEPMLVVLPLPVQVPQAQIDAACPQLLRRAGPIAPNTLEEETTIEPTEAGFRGCEGVGTNEAPGGVALSAYVAVLFHEVGAFLVTGMVGQDDEAREEWMERFKAAARTISYTR